MPTNPQFKAPGKCDVHASIFGEAIPRISSIGTFQISSGAGGHWTFHGISAAATQAMVAAYNALPVCGACGDRVDSVNDADECDECAEDRAQAEAAKLRPLYEAEKRAGLLRSKDELDQELRDAGRGHLVSP